MQSISDSNSLYRSFFDIHATDVTIVIFIGSGGAFEGCLKRIMMVVAGW